ncbi:hypothetical protein QAD02_007557 [Eretmocerus hayati]|uniref:Uncharacterized protein n=1 Tax=Eretmocerus hayati TaxID=131215 RepID=A0ACC2N8B6_9HYME|nr:hypothetical protein QAD02_007557 [Eretmocerus hayati]
MPNSTQGKQFCIIVLHAYSYNGAELVRCRLKTHSDGILTGSGAVIRNYQELLVLVGGCQKNQLQVEKMMKLRQQWIKTTSSQWDQQLTTGELSFHHSSNKESNSQ